MNHIISKILILTSFVLLLPPASAQQQQPDIIISGIASTTIIPAAKRKLVQQEAASAVKSALVPVENPARAPYNNFGKLFIADTEGNVVKTCTAFYAGPKKNMVATAASCLVDPHTGVLTAKDQVTFVRGFGTDDEQETAALCIGTLGIRDNGTFGSPRKIRLDHSYAFLYMDAPNDTGNNINLVFNYPYGESNATWKAIIYQTTAGAGNVLYEVAGNLGRSSLLAALIQMETDADIMLEGAIGGGWIDIENDPDSVIGINAFKTQQFVNDDDVLTTFWSPYLKTGTASASAVYDLVFNNGSSTDNSLCY